VSLERLGGEVEKKNYYYDNLLEALMTNQAKN